jgi:multidrug efflux pump subunit AcrB
MGNFNLSTWAVLHKSLVGFLIALLFAAGGLSYTRLGRAEDPSFTVKLLIVTAVWPGATAAETQNQVAERIERKLQDLAYLDHIVTFVRPGFAALTINFRDDTPPKLAQPRTTRPARNSTTSAPKSPAGVIGPAVERRIHRRRRRPLRPHRHRQRRTRPPGRAHPRPPPHRPRRRRKSPSRANNPAPCFVEFSHARLAALGVTVPQIAQALARQNAIAPAGIVETNVTRIPVRVEGAIDGAAALADVPVAANGRSIRLGDIATITPRLRRTAPPPKSATTARAPSSSPPPCAKAPTASTSASASPRRDRPRPRRPPVGIELQQIADQPEVIGEAVGEFLHQIRRRPRRRRSVSLRLARLARRHRRGARRAARRSPPSSW